MSSTMVCYVNLRLRVFSEISLHGLKTIYLTCVQKIACYIASDWSKILAGVPNSFYTLPSPLFNLYKEHRK